MKLQPKAQNRAEHTACSEVVVLRRAVHPFIVKLEEAFQTPTSYILLLELCVGGDLNTLLCTIDGPSGQCRGLEPARVARYSGQMLLALTYLHDAVGIIYRDIKPENVLLTASDEAKLADFGLAIFVGKDAPATQLTVAGTKGFVAPELHEGGSFCDSFVGSARSSMSMLDTARVDPYKTDSFSFGVTLELMLLGDYVATRLRAGSDEGGWGSFSSEADLMNEAGGARRSRALLSFDGRDGSMVTPTSVENIPQCDFVLSPAAATESERSERLRIARDSGRLSEAAFALLQALLPFDPSERLRLSDVQIRRHSFFRDLLLCDDLAQLLLPQQAVSPVTPSSPPTRPSYLHQLREE